MVMSDNILNEYDSTQSDCRLLLGDQGAGKTNSCVAIIVDDCYSKLIGIINPTTGEYIKSRPLNEEEVRMLALKNIRYNSLKHIRIFSSDGKSSKIISKPDGWVIDSPVRVFCNFHLYGIRFRYISAEDIVESINDDTLTNAWIALDESAVTDKQDTTTRVGKMIQKFGAQGRRRKLHTVIIAQYADMIQSRWNRFATTRVQCSYDKYTHMIELEVNRNSEFMQSTSFYAPYYWKFFKHDEIVKQIQSNVDKVMKEFYS